MKLRKPILSCLSDPTRGSKVFAVFARLCLLALFVVTGSISAPANDARPTVIVLFDGTHGAAYVQLTGMTLNGKIEVRVCDRFAKFDKNAYNALPRASFTGALSLQRREDGMLTLTVNAKPTCVVPSSLKFDKKPELTPAEAADQAVLQGSAISSSALDSGIPAFKPRVQVMFVAAPDVELAEFLRTQRANTVKDWQDFLARYPSSSRLASARKAIAALHQQAAEAAFTRYQQSGGAREQDIAMLRQAFMEAQAANQASAPHDSAIQLMDSIAGELGRLVEVDRTRLKVFQEALREHSSGYSQLAAARVHLDRLLTVRPDYEPVLNLRRETTAEERKLELTVASAELLTASARYDEAVSALQPYNSLASELPRVDAVVNAAYKYHFDRGHGLSARQDWEQAVAEFRSAAAIRPDSKEAAASLDNATFQVSAKRDQQGAKFALLKSNDYASKNQFVEAYDVLANLPDKQRVLVTSQLSALTHNYVSAATRRAQKLQEVHTPIKGWADEDAVREAYALLDRVSSLTSDPAITLKRDFLSNKISAYYVDQANRDFQKPSGSGAGVGWLYLKEAQRYGITNLDNVKNQMARYASLYRRRARLSVGIMLRDQTSRRDSPGFAEQLADSLANGLEGSGVVVEVVRKPSEVADTLQPNFMLIGEVLEHRVIKTATLETPQSKYRAGTHETKNPAWLQATSDYESAQQQLVATQQALADAQSRHRKKDIVAGASDAVQRAQKRVDELQHKLKTTDENRVEAIIEAYHYTKKTFDLSASIELAFSISDLSGNVIGRPSDIHSTNHKIAVVLQDVKPEDTEGITNQGVEPDAAELLTELEIESRNDMVKAVREKASELPANVLQEARTRAQHGDLDGAAEQYIIYLNSTPKTACPEREEAAKFLHERFNLAAPIASTL